jgi:purine-cytosine permease-like protein
MAGRMSSIASRMDRLYEFDREPVSPDKLQPGAKFAGLFAGEHVAATEFVIGAFFVLHGVAAKDLFLGLLAGNLLAVLSWTFICAPIAVRTRLTLYWYLRKIAGPGLTFVYNVANAVLYCILAGAMIAVSATAVGLAFRVKTPALNAVLPTSIGWVILTIVIGALFTALAVLGFERLSRFAEVCSPWIFIVFIAGALAVLPDSSERRFRQFLGNRRTKVWNGIRPQGRMSSTSGTSCSSPGSATWPCVGLSDLAISGTPGSGPMVFIRPSACTPAICWPGSARG